MQGQSPCPRSAERGTLLCLFKRRRGSKGEPSPGVPPFIYSWVCTCAPIRWEVFVTLPCHSTPFLWCLPKETVSSRQRKALFYPGVSTIRVSAPASVVGTFLARLGAGLVRSGGGCGRFAWSVYCAGVTVVIRFRLPPKRVSLGWNGQGQHGLLPNETAHTCKVKDKAASSLRFVRVRVGALVS